MSEHPLAKAIVAAAPADLNEADDFQAVPGRDVVARVQGQTLVAGNRELLETNNFLIDEQTENLLRQEENSGCTVMLVGYRKSILGFISVADVLRQDARELVNRLKQAGVKKVVMLTDDNKRTAQTIAQLVGVDDHCHYMALLQILNCLNLIFR